MARKKARKKKAKRKASPKVAKKPEAVMHVMLPTPLALRKHILTTAIETTQLLKQYEQFMEVKEKKARTMRYLQRTMASVHKLSKELEKSLPKLPEPEMKKLVEGPARMTAEPVQSEVKPATPVPIPKPKAPVKAAPKERSEIDMLKDELAEIEGKLGKL